MSDLCEMAKSHFNEPVLIGGDLARLIGYAEDDRDCYLVCQLLRGEVIWHTCVGGYVFLDRLKGQDKARSLSGQEWDDFTRLDSLLALNGAPKADEFHIPAIRGDTT